ncbi:MAG: ribonuclease E/G [Micavibrio sp.]|nr:ribonuclease E/G [Micavibrio sp.]
MSSGYELFIDEVDGRLHAAVTCKGVLSDLYVDPLDMTASWASLYAGKVVKIDKKLDAAIIDLGNGLQGLLPAKHVHVQGADQSIARTGIAELLAPGQMILVQVKSEGRKGESLEHNKLPRLTMKIYVMGQYLLYSPVLNRVTISRMVDAEDTLALTTRLSGKGGWIVQPGAAMANAGAIIKESEQLLSEWHIIKAERETGENRPRILKGGPNAIHRALSDYGSPHFDHIHVATKKLLDQMVAWCDRFEPTLATSKRLRLFKPEKVGQKLFEIHDIFSELADIGNEVVYLPSGGTIIFETTRAFTVVDVNQGDGANPLTVNEEAVDAVARHLKLRNISGAVIVDFISMSLKTDRFQIVTRLEQALAADAATAQVHGFTRLGLIELTRKRRNGWLAEKLR